MAASWKLGIDSGGTFTDFVLLNEESRELRGFKIPSTPANPAEAIGTGIERLPELGCPVEAVRFLSHGTTVPINALLELRGSKAGFLVTEGFKNVYEIGTMARPTSDVFNIYYSRPKLLVPPRFTQEVRERIDSKGAIVQELDEGHARSVIRDLLKKGIESIAVCLIFSFLNPRHELRLREIIHQEDSNVRVSLSCEILPKIREYVRISTTVINAYLSFVFEGYLEKLKKQLLASGIASEIFIMQSNGGIMPVDSAKKNAAFTLLSGPVAGVMAGNHIGKLCGLKNLITVDIGGTSTDVALIRDNQPMFTNEGEITGRPVGLPMVDMHTLGAGGGSIAWVDEGDRLHVGPRSAGANPGPACYGLGGSEPTVTDAYMVLGFMNPDCFAGGRIRVDKKLSEEAVKRLADKIGMETIEMAKGIIKIANANVEAGIRLVSIEKGYDPRDFVLVAFGGAGALVTPYIAKNLEVSQVLVPYQPGTTSALGLLVSDPKHTHLLSRIAWFDEVHQEEMEGIFNELEVKGKEKMVSEGFERDKILVHRSLGLRYIGQGYDVSVPVGKSITNKEDKHHLRILFDDLHESQYGHRAPQQPLEVCYYQVDTVVPVTVPKLAEARSSGRSVEECVKVRRQVYFPEEAHFVDTPIYSREQLSPGMMIAGPAIVEEDFSTTVVYPGQSARVDRYKNVLIEVKGRS